MNNNFPQVAIVGRTNSGKSTLFNRLSESNKAITSPLINTTRDRNFADIAWQGKIFTLVDTGGLDTSTEDELDKDIQKQVQTALNKADLILFLVDGSHSLMPQDKDLAKKLHQANKPIILGINQIDNQKKAKLIDPDFYKLNFTHSAQFSAKNGSQTGDLLDLITTLLPDKKTSKKIYNEALKIAIIGRPNVGKSSLINAILGQERVIVSEQAHTTRDINDVEFIYENKKIILVDTAGLRRKNRVGRWQQKLMAKIEKQGVQATVRAMDEADIVILVLEAQQTVNSQDQALVQLATSHRKKLIIAINKWDLIDEKDSNTIDEFAKYFDSKIPFAKWAPMIFISALQGQRVKKILDLALEIQTQSQKHIDTDKLKEILDKIKNKYKPKQRQVVTFGQKKRDLKLKRLEQIKIDLPLFKLKTPTPKNVPPAIVKIIEKEIRERYEFLGVPIRITIDK